MRAGGDAALHPKDQSLYILEFVVEDGKSSM